jgi:PilZ domain-containing protein
MHRLKEFDTIALALPDDGMSHDTSFACRVIAKAGATVALEPLERAKATWLPERLPGAFIVFRHDGALVALKGVLVQQGSVGDLRFKVTDDVAPSKASRTRIHLPVSLRPTDLDVDEVQGLSVELSGDALLIRTSLDAPVGSQLDAVLSLPGSDEPVELRAHVVHAADGLLELEIDARHREARARLARFVLERNRAALPRDPVDGDSLDF